MHDEGAARWWESDTDSDGSEDEADFTEGNNLSKSQVLALCMWLAKQEVCRYNDSSQLFEYNEIQCISLCFEYNEYVFPM